MTPRNLLKCINYVGNLQYNPKYFYRYEGGIKWLYVYTNGAAAGYTSSAYITCGPASFDRILVANFGTREDFERFFAPMDLDEAKVQIALGIMPPTDEQLEDLKEVWVQRW